MGKKGSNLVNRQWLHNEVSRMLDKYVMDRASHLEDMHNELAVPQASSQEHPCRFPTCTKISKYVKCLLRHERKAHGLDLGSPFSSKDERSDEKSSKGEESKVNGVYDYGCQTLSLGLLLRDADDAVKGGDGERLCRIWKFLTLLYRFGGNNKYALASLRLTAWQVGLLTPRQAHQLK